MKKLIIIAGTILLIVVIVTSVLLFRNNTSQQKSDVISAPSPTITPSTSRSRTFVLYVKNWEFDPNIIRLKQGDRVTLQVKSLDVKHGIAIPDFNRSASLDPFKFVTIQFTAQKRGTFEYICTLNCGPAGYKGMKGVIIVE